MTDFGKRTGAGDMLKSVYDANDDGVVDEVIAHKASHQDAGTDEISVTGLSGELADNQPPKAHAIGSASHTASTLAQLNTKLSDATLDDSSDTRTPSAHKTSHQNGGADELSVAGLSGELADDQPPKTHAASHEDGGGDEISATGLVGRINLVNRGDPSTGDFSVGVLTTNGAWHDLDCSSVVPAGAIAIQFRVYVLDDAANSYMMFRKKGNSYDHNTQKLRIKVANIADDGQPVVFCDSNRVIQYWASNTTWETITIVITGWFI